MYVKTILQTLKFYKEFHHYQVEKAFSKSIARFLYFENNLVCYLGRIWDAVSTVNGKPPVFSGHLGILIWNSVSIK